MRSSAKSLVSAMYLSQHDIRVSGSRVVVRTFFEEGCYFFVKYALYVVAVVRIVQKCQDVVCEDISIGVRSRR